ncbi:zinc finger protein 26-like [Dermacentor albipictus]|uniref:zinc finger protein 26-like n=1 Tax=Dermacentor albipictus TaxID=60249 RepID=UPI0038FC0AC0
MLCRPLQGGPLPDQGIILPTVSAVLQPPGGHVSPGSRDSTTLTSTEDGRSQQGLHCRYPFCYYKAETRLEMEKHIKIHNDEHTFQCDFCPRSFSRKDRLTAHLSSHTGNRPFACHFCRKTFTRDDTLKVHMRIHTGERPFQCHLCPQSFTVKSSLKEHLRIHTGERPYHCKICCMSFVQSSSMNTHMKTQHPHATYMRLTQVSAVIKPQTTEEHSRIGRIKASSPPYNCQEPGVAAEASHLLRSIRLSTVSAVLQPPVGHVSPGSRDSTSLTTIEDGRPQQGLHCHYPLCYYEAETLFELEKHLMIHKDVRTLQCDFCPLRFSRKSKLALHLRSHTGEKPFQCPSCPRRFSRKDILKKHLCTHTGDRPFACRFCRKTFIRDDKLKLHMRTHTGERPFQCHLCPQTFTMRSCLKAHLRIHTGERPYHCNICCMSFVQSGHLKTHMKTQHPDATYTPNHRRALKDWTDEEEVPSSADVEASAPFFFHAQLANCKSTMKRSISLDPRSHGEATDTKIRATVSAVLQPPVGHVSPGSRDSTTLTSTEDGRSQQGLHCRYPFCYYEAETLFDLEKHVKIHKDERTFQCDFCPRSFSRKDRLAQHLSTHTGNRPFACRFCRKTFIRGDTLKVHMRIHTGERPFQCHFCPQTFTLKSCLKEHLRIHTGERPYHCNICCMSFVQSGHLNTHMKRQHPDAT